MDEHGTATHWVLTCPHHGVRARIEVEDANTADERVARCSLLTGPPASGNECDETCLRRAVLERVPRVASAPKPSPPAGSPEDPFRPTRPILAPIDDPELATCLFWHVEPILGPDGPQVVLLDAHPTGQAPDLRVARLERLLEASGVDACTELVEADLAEATLERVRTLDPSLVLLATGARRSALAERLLRRCSAPLLLFSPDTVTSRFQRILVPLDGSEHSARILPLVTWLASVYGSHVVLLHVHPASSHDGSGGLEPEAQRLESHGVHVSRLVARDDDPADAILSTVELERIDLVAMTTHGRTALEHWAFGSVTEKVLGSCHVPLLVRRVVDAPRRSAPPAKPEGWGEPGMRTRQLDLRRVLLPLDGSRFSERAVRVIPRLLDGEGVACTLLHVLPEAVAQGPAGDAKAALDVAKADLQALCDDLPRQDWSFEARVVVGDPAARIVAAAQEGPADLVVMASRCRAGVSRWLRGSVAGRVLRRSDVPVLVCPPRWLEHAFWDAGGIRRILVPLDGSEASSAALPLAEDLARRQEARLILLRVGPALPEVDARSRAKELRLLAYSLEDERARIAAAGISVQVQVVQGDVVEEILAASAKADLVAMATHGRSGAARWMLGSVAEQVLLASAHPLLLVRSS